jgi:hypothetical protein
MVFISFILCSPFTCHGTPPGLISPVFASYDTEHTYEGSHDLKLAIATEMLETVDWEEETQAKARQYLYDLLMQDTVLANSNSAFLDFIAEYEGWLQSVYEVSNDLRNIEQYDSLFNSLIAEADSLIRFYSDSLTVIYDAGMEEELSQTVEDFYYQINFLEQTKSNLISQRQAFVEGELGELTHDYVISSELPNVNTQYINYVYSALLESGDNDEIIFEEYSSLLAVASQCPAAGGQSVYRARAMLSLVNDSLEYNDAVTCLQSGIYRESVSENEISGIEIIPNPATNLITVKINNSHKGYCNIKILNTFGGNMIEARVNCEQPEHTISTRKLPPGVYFVHVEFDGSINVEKLVIVK